MRKFNKKEGMASLDSGNALAESDVNSSIHSPAAAHAQKDRNPATPSVLANVPDESAPVHHSRGRSRTPEHLWGVPAHSASHMNDDGGPQAKAVRCDEPDHISAMVEIDPSDSIYRT